MRAADPSALEQVCDTITCGLTVSLLPLKLTGTRYWYHFVQFLLSDSSSSPRLILAGTATLSRSPPRRIACVARSRSTIIREGGLQASAATATAGRITERLLSSPRDAPRARAQNVAPTLSKRFDKILAGYALRMCNRASVT